MWLARKWWRLRGMLLWNLCSVLKCYADRRVDEGLLGCVCAFWQFLTISFWLPHQPPSSSWGSRATECSPPEIFKRSLRLLSMEITVPGRGRGSTRCRRQKKQKDMSISSNLTGCGWQWGLCIRIIIILEWELPVTEHLMWASTMLGALRVWFQPVLPSVLSRRYNDKPYFLDKESEGPRNLPRVPG